MSSLSAKDRVSLCSFTFSDGRRCRTPRTGKNSRFCSYHAQKEAQARATEKLGKDLAYFFSGNYLSACDLSTALSRLIPAVVRGDVKPKTARTVAYLLQTLLQTIHISQHEYINAFGTEGWRQSVRNSVNGNQDYLYPPTTPRSGGLQAGPAPQPEKSESPQPHPAAPPQTQSQPALVVHPLTGGASPSVLSSQPAATPNHLSNAAPPQPADIPISCHSERSEEPAFSSSPTPPTTSAHTPKTPLAHPTPRTQFAPPVASASQPASPDQGRRGNPPHPRPSTPRLTANRDSHALHFDHNCRLLIDGKPF